MYMCGCKYNTSDPGNANKHKKVSCGHEMKIEMTEFVMKKDYDIAVGKTHTVGDTVQRDKIIDNSTHNDNSTVNITDNSITNVTLVLPERTTKEDFVVIRNIYTCM